MKPQQSQSNKANYLKVKTKVCMMCKADMSHKRPIAKFCTPRCAQKAYNYRDAEKPYPYPQFIDVDTNINP